MFGDIYVCYRKISKIWHTQFSIQNVTSFSEDKGTQQIHAQGALGDNMNG